jgi:hypothetical protein
MYHQSFKVNFVKEMQNNYITAKYATQITMPKVMVFKLKKYLLGTFHQILKKNWEFTHFHVNILNNHYHKHNHCPQKLIKRNA